MQTWTPESVNVWHKKLVQQTPTDSDKRLRDLEAKIKVNRLLLKGIRKRLEMKKEKVEALQKMIYINGERSTVR